jgi:predicted permease
MLLKNAYRRLRALFQHKSIEADMEKELQLHLELLARNFEESGMTAEDARLAARRKFGNMTGIRERGRDVRGAGMLEVIGQDLRYAFRMIRRSPGFTTVVVLSLALGIGVNTALFSVIDAAYLRKLPVREPDELVGFGWNSRGWFPRDLRGYSQSRNPGTDSGAAWSAAFPYSAFERFRSEGTTLSQVFAAGQRFEASAISDGQVDSVSGQAVSGNYFLGLALSTTAGRALVPEDDQVSAQPAAVIAHRFWRARFGKDPGAIGKKVTLNGLGFTIVGVTPEEFKGTNERGVPDFLIPLAFESAFRGAPVTPETWAWTMLGRMRDGVKPQEVHADLENVLRNVAGAESEKAALGLRLEVHSASWGEPRIGSRSALEETLESLVFGRGRGRRAAMFAVLSFLFGLVLLIVCLNVGNLLTARSAARQYEIGVRLAIGAGRHRLIRQLLTESFVLALLGGASGSILAFWSKELLGTFLQQDLDLRINPQVLGFTLLVSLIAGLIFGLVPALQTTNRNVLSVVQKNSRNPGVGRSRLSKSLVLAQVALSAVLLVGAGLLLRTLGNLPDSDAGFNIDNLLVFRLNPVVADDQANRVIERIRAIPGVLAATSSSVPLIGNNSESRSVYRKGAAQEPGASGGQVLVVRGRPDFLQVMDVRLVHGRHLGAGDVPGAGKVAVISEGLARRLFPASDPVGRELDFGNPDLPDSFTVVGVVRDVGLSNVGNMAHGAVYLSGLQTNSGNTYFEVRAQSVANLLQEIRQAARETDPGLSIIGVTTQSRLIAEKLAPIRRTAISWSLFGAVALVLTCIGLYGLLSYGVTSRTNEIGIRMALGAGPSSVIRLVMGQTFFLVAIGLGIGLLGSVVLNLTMRTLIFGVSLYDPPTIGIVIALMLGVTAAAAYLPARRAARIDPTVALRLE